LCLWVCWLLHGWIPAHWYIHTLFLLINVTGCLFFRLSFFWKKKIV
jgi:hypothetical protein